MADKMFKLEKLSMDPEMGSRVCVGATQTGYARLVSADRVEVLVVDDVEQVLPGYQLLVHRSITSWLGTSPIKEILERGTDYVKFQTRTSTYELRELSNDKTT